MKLDRGVIVRILGAGLLLLAWNGCRSREPADEANGNPMRAAAAPVQLHGANLVGMEGTYTFDRRKGPIPNVDYAVHSTSVIDYLASKDVNVLRFLFSWERMQSSLDGDVPAATTGNYRAYFDDYMRIVDYATNVKNMTVIVTPWQTTGDGQTAGGARWRGELVGGGVVTNAHFANFWSKMATIVRDRPRVAIGLITEPNQTDTMRWFRTAQDAISAIRKTGFEGEIYVPGNGWTAAGSWHESWYDTGTPARSNAYGWLNARGPGQPLADPLDKLVVEVHTYADPDASGSSANVVSGTISRTRVAPLVDWARGHRLKVFIGETGMYAAAPNAAANWTDFVGYMGESSDVITGFAWWACGKPGWWDDVGASGGGHFSITPTDAYRNDTVNMSLFAIGAASRDGGADADVPGARPDAGPFASPDSSEGNGEADDEAGSDEDEDEDADEERAAPASSGSRRGASSAKQAHTAPAASSSTEDEVAPATSGCSVALLPRVRPDASALVAVSALVGMLGVRRRRR